MKEFKHIFLTQTLTILFLSGVALGTLAGYPVYHTKVVRITPEQVYPEVVMNKAMKYRGTLVAYYKDKAWLFVDKKGVPCKVFNDDKFSIGSMEIRE